MGMTEENKRLFKEAIAEGLSHKTDRRIAEYEEEIKTKKEHKIAMNRIFKEFEFAPYPEEET